MKNSRWLSIILLFIFFGLHHAGAYSQQWEFIKEREGIRVYTCTTENSSVKSFKGETYLRASMESIASLLGNANNFDWWDESISDIRVLEYREEQYIRYYLVYNVPWPVTDRDLCVEANITKDPATGTRVVDSKALNGVVPEEPGLVRITKYWQRWTAKPEGDGMVHLVLEGFADPAGYIPAWIYNMVITDTPLNVIRKIRDRAAMDPQP